MMVMEKAIFTKHDLSIVGCCGIILNRRKEILLEKHKKRTPWYGYWILPGGKLEMGESLENCVKREIKEEVGIDVKIKRLVSVFVSKESRNLSLPIVLVFFLAEPLCEEIKIREDEIKDAKWFALKEIKNLRIHPDAIKALKDAGLLK